MKQLLLKIVPVIVLACAALFGLNADEQSVLAQSLTDIIIAAFAIVPIAVHIIEQYKAKKSK